MRRSLSLFVLGCLLLPAGAFAPAGGIRLKTRTRIAGDTRAPGPPLRRRAAGRSHWLAEFARPVDARLRAALARSGVRVTSHLGANAAAVAVPDGLDLAAAGALRIMRLEAADKVSPLVAEDVSAALLVEFHADVSGEDARALVRENGLEVLEHPDVLPHQVLVAGDRERIAALAAWDEVAYIFPADPDLVAGRPMAACAGALTEQGLAAQYVNVGTGWGSPSLGYFIHNLTGRLDRSAAESEILRAFAEWARYAPLEFTPASGPAQARTIAVLFARGAHGDGYAFDGPGKVLAHTFYPAPPNREPVAGDMHLDDDEAWQVGARVDLFTVALHELGHALGLGHSDRPGSVMYPYYRQATGLGADDIAGVRELYGSREGNVAPPGGEPGGGPPPPPPPRPALSLVIAKPAAAAVVTSSASLEMAGRTANGTGAVEVTWSTDRGRLGRAAGAADWTATVPLETGANTITVSATDKGGTRVSSTVRATREEAGAPAPAAAPPALRITSPAFTIVSTAQPALTVRGTASEPVRGVTWSTSGGAAGEAAGTAYWVAADIPLLVGTNTVTIRAWGPSGASSWRSLTVVRR